MLVLAATIAFCIWWLGISHLYAKIELFGRKPFNRKPFSCEACLPFYVAAILYFVPPYVNEYILIIFAAPVLTTYLLKLLAKWQ